MTTIHALLAPDRVMSLPILPALYVGGMVYVQSDPTNLVRYMKKLKNNRCEGTEINDRACVPRTVGYTAQLCSLGSRHGGVETREEVYSESSVPTKLDSYVLDSVEVYSQSSLPHLA